jgi:hypothetical protein
MSYILDALKKADRERSLAKVPTLTTVQLPVHMAARRTALWAVGIVLVGGGVAAWFWWPSPPGVSVAPVGSGKGVEAPAPLESLTLERPPAQPVSPTVTPPAQAARPPAVPPVASPRESVRRIEPEVPAMRRPIRTAPPPPKATLLSPDPTASAPATASPAPLSPRHESAPQRGREQIPAAPVPTAPPPPPAQPTLREASAKLTLDVFVYTDAEADRMVVIAGKRYVKGQFVEGLYLLEDITPEGAVLSSRGERIVLRP